MKAFSLPTSSYDLDVRTVHRAGSARPFNANFMLLGTGSFLAGGGNLLRYICRCENPLRIGYAVVFDEYNLDSAIYNRIVVDNVRHAVDRRWSASHSIACSGLCAEDKRFSDRNPYPDDPLTRYTGT